MSDTLARKPVDNCKNGKKVMPKGTSFSNPTELVTLEVSPEKKRFVLHKEFACHYSPVLKAAFNSIFLEGQTQTYSLPDVEKADARLLINWLYTQQLDISRYEKGHPKKPEEDLTLCKLWVLADRLFIRPLQNLVIHTMADIREASRACPTNALPYVWDNTIKGSPLRLLLLHQCAAYLHAMWYEEYPHQFPKEMLIELVGVLGKFADPSDMEENCGIKDNFAQYEVSED